MWDDWWSGQLWRTFLSSNQLLLIWCLFPGSCNRSVLFKKVVIFKLTFNIETYSTSSACNTLADFWLCELLFILQDPIQTPPCKLAPPTSLPKPRKSLKPSIYPSSVLLQECLFTTPYNMWEMTVRDIFLARWTTELEEKRLFLMYHCIPNTQHNAWHLTNDLKLVLLNECSYSFWRGMKGKKYV